MLGNKLSENVACITYLTVKIMPKRHVLLTNRNLRNSTNLSRLFVCLFLNSYTRERGNNRDINDNDNDNDFIIWQTAIAQRPFLSEESTISMYRRYLPVHLTPFQKYPGSLQIHRKDPLVLWHMELPLQLCFPVAHSFTSAKQEVLLFSLPFF